MNDDHPESWLENSYHNDEVLCSPLNECMSCGERDCPEGYGEHYWDDGCPANCTAKMRQRLETTMARIYERLRQNPVDLSSLPPPSKTVK